MTTTSMDATLDGLRAHTLSDVVRLAEEDGREAVEAFLSAALDVTADFLAEHDKGLSRMPDPIYEPYGSGVEYDPLHEQAGEVLIFGGPRGNLRGGYQVLGERRGFVQQSLLTILSKGLLHSYNHHLVEEHFEREGMDAGRGRSDAGIELYDRLKLLNPAVDQALTHPFGLYLEADIADRGLREAFIDAWATWYEEFTDMRVPVFEAVSYTVSDRIDEAEGSPKERIVHGLAIQEPLVRDARIELVTHRSSLTREGEAE